MWLHYMRGHDGSSYVHYKMAVLLLFENSMLKYLIAEKKRKYWVNDLYKTRKTESEYVRLFNELKQQPSKFFQYFRMSESTFDYILHKIERRIQKHSNFRECIEPREKLTITLRWVFIINNNFLLPVFYTKLIEN